MKKITIGIFSLTALVAMTAISAKTVRAAGSLEDAKAETGWAFGEMGGLNGRAASAVNASSDGAGRPALTVGKLDVKAIRESADVPAPTYNGNGIPGGLLSRSLTEVGRYAGIAGTIVAAFSGGSTLLLLGLMGGLGALEVLQREQNGMKSPKNIAKAAGRGFLAGTFALAAYGAAAGYFLGRGIEIGAGKIGSLFKKGYK